MKYSPRVRQLRKKFGYTQEYVANYLKCKRSAYSNWESWNIIIPLDMAEKLAMLYNVPMSYVLGYNDDNNKVILKPIDYEHIKNKLIEMKLKYNHSYHQIGKYIDTNKSTVQRYFTGKVKIPTDKLMSLCRLYEIEIDELCGTK